MSNILKVTARIQTISRVHRHTVTRMVSVLCAAELNYMCPVLFSRVSWCSMKSLLPKYEEYYCLKRMTTIPIPAVYIMYVSL